MTNYFNQLDMQLQQLRNAYLSQWLRGQYQQAADLLFAMNLALGEDGADFPQFEFHRKANRGSVLADAYQYCRTHHPEVEAKMGMVRTENLESYNQL